MDNKAPSQNENNTNDEKVMGDAIKSLARVMAELEQHYTELQDVLEESLESQWKWQEYKRDADRLTLQAEELRVQIPTGDSDTYNDVYSVMQSVKTSFHELSKRRDEMPIKKHNRAEKKLEHLEQVIAEIFTELGKSNEKMVNTEFVLNIQFDILSWIKEFESLLYITEPDNEDVLRLMLAKDSRIRRKLKYCPIEVIEEYFTICEKIGTEFLLAAVLGVETCITRLVEDLAETSQQFTFVIKTKAAAVARRVASMLDRIRAIDGDEDILVEQTTSLEKMASLIGTFSEIQPIECPGIADLSALKFFHKAELLNHMEVFEELLQSIQKFIQSESDELPPLSQFNRSRSGSRGSVNIRSPFSSSGSRMRSESLRVLQRLIPKTLDEYLDRVEDGVKRMEEQHLRRKMEDVSARRTQAAEKQSQKLFHILKEFKDTEKSYIKSIEYLAEELILRALSDGDFTLDSSIRDCLETAHDIICQILKLNTHFYQQLRSCNGGSLKYAQVFTSLIPRFSSYTLLIKHQAQLEQILSRDYFNEIQAFNSDPLPAVSYINKPMQRLAKYKQFFESILANTSNVFEIPSINQGVLQSRKLLKTINDIFHLQEEVFIDMEKSEFYLYAKVTLQESSQGDRKAFLFRNHLYLSKPSKDYVSYEMKSLTLQKVDKAKLELVFTAVALPGAGTSTTMRRSASLKKIKGPATVTLMFQEYTELVEWLFKLKNVLGKYY